MEKEGKRLGRKILVVSDSHGKNTNLEKVIRCFGDKGKDLELLIHLGDMECPLERIQRLVSCPVKAVRGNCDFSNLPAADFVMIGEEKAMVTHGHRYQCKLTTDMMKEMAAANGASIVLFGHTHMPMLDLGGAVKVANPGSISLPRQEGHRPTYLVITIEDDGRLQFVNVEMK